uniref:Ig-like domain-containing protein n=1 Tax=Anabas testudineus TaxID=64144 RepID=A0A7N6BF82_ANATE
VQMEHWLWIILAALCFGKMGNKPTDYVTATEGDAVTLNCTFETSYTAYLFWYKQEKKNFPNAPWRRMRENVLWTEPNLLVQFIRSVKPSTEFHLQISSAAVSDSAVYYCALSETY